MFSVQSTKVDFMRHMQLDSQKAAALLIYQLAIADHVSSSTVREYIYRTGKNSSRTLKYQVHLGLPHTYPALPPYMV